MNVIPTAILDVLIIAPKVFGDTRDTVFDMAVDIRKSSPIFS